MDNQIYDAGYPDPGAPAFITPYPSGYDSSSGHAFGGPSEEDYYPPRIQPVIHEGFVPRSGYDSDVDEDPNIGYHNVRAQSGLNHVLNPHNSFHHDPFGARLDGALDDDYDNVDFEGPEEVPSRLNSIERDILAANQDADVDSDFRASDEGRSDDDMSINSDMLDDILAEESTRGRGRGRGARGGRRGRGWKWALKGTEHDPALAKRGRGGGRGRGRGNGVPRGEGRRKVERGGQKTAEPNPEFKRLQALATQNFLSQDLEAAADYAREAVKTNPEIFAAHSLLAEILQAEGKMQDALTVLLAGAHTKRDPTLWWQVGNDTLLLAGENRTPEVLEQAIYCYAWTIKLDPSDFDSRQAKLNLLLESGQTAKARAECKMMIRARPYTLDLVNLYAELCAETCNPYEIKRAKEAYDNAIELYSKGKTLGAAETQWSHMNIYMDLVEADGTLSEAIKRLKSLSRWLLGRREDEWWDEIEGDDREYDLDDVPRRIQLPQFKQSKFQGARDRYGKGLPLELRVKLGTYRARMGRVYLHEAMRHFDVLMALVEDVATYADLFRDVAETLRVQTYYKEAIQFYEPLRSVPDALENDYYMHIADCYVEVGRKDDAEASYKYIVENDEEDVESRIALARFYETEGRMSEAVPYVHQVMALGKEDRVKRARLEVDKPPKQRPRRPAAPRQISMPDEEVDDTTEAEDEDDEDEEGEKDAVPARTKKKKPRARRARVYRPSRPRHNETSEILQEQETRVRSNYILYRTAKKRAEEGDHEAVEEWMTHAHALLQDFRAMKVFYPGRDKHIKFTGYSKHIKTALQNEMEAMKRRLQPDDEDEPEPEPDVAIPNEFHQISFQDWLDIFCSYAIQLAKNDERSACYDTMNAAFYGSVFYHNEYAKKQVHATWIACALIFNDEETLCNSARWFISEFSHSSSTYQLFAAVNRLFAGSSNWFNSGPTQKFILRSVKALDYALLDPEGRARYSFTGTERSSYTHGGKKDANPHNLKELDPAVLALYGHIMAAAQSWASALNYYYRVFVLLPSDATINLCIGLAYIQMSMKRQSENRHWQIYQGLAFFERYSQLKLAKPGAGVVDVQEAEYNRGRVYHLLGLSHLAIPAYEKCLAMAEEIARERERELGRERVGGAEINVDDNVDVTAQEEFTQEAAFALASIFSLADNEIAARKVTEKWLVI